MALSSTMHQITLDLSDTDRGVYEQLELAVARHPSENEAFLVTRLLAYALEYGPGIAFSRGLGVPDEPAVWAHDLTGRLLAWVDLGTPDAARLHRASKAADRVAVYCHKEPDPWLRSLAGQRIHNAQAIKLVLLDRGFVGALAEAVGRRTALSLTVTEGELYVDVGALSLHTTLQVAAVPA